MHSPQTSVSSPELPIPPAAAIAVQFSVVVDPLLANVPDESLG